MARHSKPDIFNTDQGSQFYRRSLRRRARQQRYCDGTWTAVQIGSIFQRPAGRVIINQAGSN